MEFIHLIFPLSLFTFITFIYLTRNPVYGVLAFVAVVAHVVGLLILLDLEFLAYVLAIVYIGAIVVLFLFVIMMFYIHHFNTKRSFVRGGAEYYLLGWASTNLAYYVALSSYIPYVDFIEVTLTNNVITLVAWYLFNSGLLLTIIITLIMLIGIIGAIILTVRVQVPTTSNIRVRNAISDAIKKVE